MKHIIANPHNGAPVEAHGVKLEPGFALEVTEAVAIALKKSFEFLHHSQEKGDPKPAKAKPSKLKQKVEWNHVTAPDTDPQPDQVGHSASKVPAKKTSTPKKAAPKKAPAKKKGKK